MEEERQEAQTRRDASSILELQVRNITTLIICLPTNISNPFHQRPGYLRELDESERQVGESSNRDSEAFASSAGERKPDKLSPKPKRTEIHLACAGGAAGVKVGQGEERPRERKRGEDGQQGGEEERVQDLQAAGDVYVANGGRRGRGGDSSDASFSFLCHIAAAHADHRRLIRRRSSRQGRSVGASSPHALLREDRQLGQRLLSRLVFPKKGASLFLSL